MEAYIYDELQKREKNDWWFVGRRKIILTLLNKYFKNKNNLSIVDIGCGAGDVIDLLKPFGKVVGVDNNKGIVEFNKKKGRNVILGQSNKLNFPNKAFNLATLFEVLEHLDNDKDTLKEMHRVLKPHGMFLMTVPAYSFLWSSHDVVAHHKRRYTTKEINKKLTMCGFRVIKITYMNTFLFPIIFSVRLLRNIFKAGGKKSDFLEYPPLINKILEQIFSLESIFLARLNFPFGVSVLVVAEKI